MPQFHLPKIVPVDPASMDAVMADPAQQNQVGLLVVPALRSEHTVMHVGAGALFAELTRFAHPLEPEPAEGFRVLHPARWFRVKHEE